MRYRSAALLCLAFGLSACASEQLQDQQALISGLESHVASLSAKIKDKDSRIAALTSAKADLDSSAKELTDKLAAGQAQIDSLQQSNKDLSQAIESSKGDMTNKIKDLVAAKDLVASKLNEVRKQKSVSERLRAVLQAQLDVLQQQHDELANKHEALLAEAAARQTQRSARLKQAHEDLGAIADSVLKEIESDLAAISQDGDLVQLTLQEPLLFEPQQAKITEKGASLLDRLGAALRALPGRALRIQAHSDNAPIKWELFGRFTSHWDLSAARATAVARYLHEHSGLDPHKMIVEGCGEFRPVKDNGTAEGRAANRRVMIAVEQAP